MPRHVDHSARRGEIIHATLSILAEKGPRAVTFRAVAQRMGGSSTLVTHYFKSRQELLDALVETVAEWPDDLQELEAGVDDPRERLRLFMHWMVPADPEAYMEERARISLAGGHDGSVRTQGIFDAWQAGVRAQFVRHLDGLVPSSELDPVIDILRSITNGITLSVIEHPDDWPAERQWQVIDDALERLGLAAPVE
jgi:AcrR family transcriptional regulator